ncbi:hypothetical protein GSI_09903 [Ganoderma sinense ZZ0214-1]|uniref:Uncharacterized protein n=1 Tax=Ganoderma sinense ZZ0214-1 TaxID=1077348 RepID=A0A2G8S2F7_9APHY|nr:hypothetical protein GSI_09903 [Ganoderma sinense ZZ0214-1]
MTCPRTTTPSPPGLGGRPNSLPTPVRPIRTATYTPTVSALSLSSMCRPGELYRHRRRLYHQLDFGWVQDGQPARFTLTVNPDHNNRLFAWFVHTQQQGNLERLHRFLQQTTPTAYLEYTRTGEYSCFIIESFLYCPHIHTSRRHAGSSA